MLPENFTTQLVNDLMEYFAARVPLLADQERGYSWPLPKHLPAGFSPSPNASSYEQTVELKLFLSNLWPTADSQLKTSLAKWIVEDWGGVRSNKKGTIQDYVNQFENDTPITALAGVASYSKIYSAALPEKYAIFDARVAAALNAIQLLKRTDKGVAFPYIAGRNKYVGNATTGEGFTQQDRFKPKQLVNNHGWIRVPQKDVFEYYLEVLNLCLEKLPSAKLYDLEMVLFSTAPEICKKLLLEQ